MKKLSGLICFGSALAVLLFATAAAAKNLAVSPAGAAEANCPFPLPHFSSIQAAVDAASPGDKVNVCPGTYAEQVKITKTMAVVGPSPSNHTADNDVAMVMPGALTQNAVTPTGRPIAAVIAVVAASGRNPEVELRNLIVDAANNGISDCAGPTVVGIYYNDAFGPIHRNVVRNTMLAKGSEGCQNALGILVTSSGAGASAPTVIGNSVQSYQKNGITVDGPVMDVLVRGNIITGNGPTTAQAAAQNGIQISRGATGVVVSNTVTNNMWAGCTLSGGCDTAIGIDILVFQTNDVTVHFNIAGISQGGIFLLNADHGQLNNNNVFAVPESAGIVLEGNNNDAFENAVTNTPAAFAIAGNDNDVHDNVINDALIGIAKASSSSGNNLSGNLFYNTIQPILDPALHLAKPDIAAATRFSKNTPSPF